MSTNNKKFICKKKNFLFFIAYIPWFISTFLVSTGYAELSVLQITRYICYACFLMSIVSTTKKIHIAQGIGLGIISLITLISAYASGSNTFIFVILVMVAAKDIDIKTLLKLTAILAVFLTVFVLLSCKLGIIHDKTNTKFLTNIVRHSFGFHFSNNLSVHLLYIVIVILMCFSQRFLLTKYFIVQLLNWVVFKYTNSRTCFILCIFVCIFHFLYYSGVRFKVLYNKWLCFCITLLLCLFPVVTSFFFKANEKWNLISTVLFTGRLRLQHEALLRYGINLFGSVENSLYNNVAFVDSSIFRLFIFYGVIMYIIFVCLTMKMVNEFVKDSQIYLIVMVWLMLFDGWYEGFLFNVSGNHLLILYTCLLKPKIINTDTGQYKNKLMITNEMLHKRQNFLNAKNLKYIKDNK